MFRGYMNTASSSDFKLRGTAGAQRNQYCEPNEQTKRYILIIIHRYTLGSRWEVTTDRLFALSSFVGGKCSSLSARKTPRLSRESRAAFQKTPALKIKNLSRMAPSNAAALPIVTHSRLKMRVSSHRRRSKSAVVCIIRERTIPLIQRVSFGCHRR